MKTRFTLAECCGRYFDNAEGAFGAGVQAQHEFSTEQGRELWRMIEAALEKQAQMYNAWADEDHHHKNEIIKIESEVDAARAVVIDQLEKATGYRPKEAK